MAAGEAQAILAQGLANANSIKMINDANSASYTNFHIVIEKNIFA